MSFLTNKTESLNRESRISSDIIRNTQYDLQNTKYANYILTSFEPDSTSSDIVYFVSQNPSLTINASHRGEGVSKTNIEMDTEFLITNPRKTNDLHLSTRNENQRPYLTLPYLGKGQGDIVIESKLIRGEPAIKKDKLIEDRLFSNYQNHPSEEMIERVKNGDGVEKTNDSRVGERARYIMSNK
jgi:hypothetical protein